MTAAPLSTGRNRDDGSTAALYRPPELPATPVLDRTHAAALAVIFEPEMRDCNDAYLNGGRIKLGEIITRAAFIDAAAHNAGAIYDRLTQAGFAGGPGVIYRRNSNDPYSLAIEDARAVELDDQAA